MNSDKKIISTDAAPRAIGSYSQAIRTGNTVYISGQIPLDPETMQVVSEDFAEQANQAFKNLFAVIEAAAGKPSDIVKLNIYLTSMKNYPVVSEIMEQYWQPPYPARAVIGVQALPKQVAIEMDAILVLDK